MALEVKVGVQGRNHIRIDYEALWRLVHTVTVVSARQEGLPSANSRATRLNKKLEMMSTGIRQNETGYIPLDSPLANNDESQLGQWASELDSLSD